MTIADPFSDAGASVSGESGGEPSSSDGSSSTATDAVTELSLGDRVKVARELKGLSRYAVDKEMSSSGLTKRIEEEGYMPRADTVIRLGGILGVDLSDAPPPIVSRQTSTERRPAASDSAKSKRRLLGGRRAKVEPGGVAPVTTRPQVRRVSTSPLTESLLTFTAGGLSRIGQGPLAAVMSFTSPVAGEIVDDAIAGTVADKLVQPLVRGSEEYQNLAALVAVYGSVAWASNVPEAADQAYGLFQWSMQTLLPLQGKEMVRRAKEQRKAAEAMAEIMPELVEMFGTDPIAGLWRQIWAQRTEPTPEPEPAHA